MSKGPVGAALTVTYIYTERERDTERERERETQREREREREREIEIERERESDGEVRGAFTAMAYDVFHASIRMKYFLSSFPLIQICKILIINRMHVHTFYRVLYSLVDVSLV